jgi:salicylate hydroxylase
MSGRAGVLRVAIVGGGIGGVGAANARHQHGLDVKVYEQASALTEVGRVSPFS